MRDLKQHETLTHYLLTTTFWLAIIILAGAFLLIAMLYIQAKMDERRDAREEAKDKLIAYAESDVVLTQATYGRPTFTKKEQS